ncbi:Adhesin protein [Phytophthora megakarya]|uniref:Adhesin protein n=1 Tax=Phytophthora megakarya TaxID=4795 RepID=A0A225X230_9STRA|nr:Adhesin protein [Phytophthora megakarya]
MDSASPRTDVSWPSDEEPNDLLLVENQKKPPVKPRSNATFSTEGMSPEAVKQHKAQRRREQVRAASRRCRDRQRKETEDLRTKVFQLEEFITHTMQAHEWERRQQSERIQTLQHENDMLTQQLAAATADVIEPVPLGTPVKLEDSTLPDDLVDCISDDVPSQWSEDLVYHAVEDTTQQLVTMLESQIKPVKSPIIFGWQFDFWSEGDRYFGRNRKFFPGVTALELAKRMQTVDPQRYMETRRGRNEATQVKSPAMEQQVAEASPIDHVKTEEREPEPQLDGAASPMDENQNKKKKKKKKKNRRKSLEKTQIDEIKARNEEEDNQASNEETTVAEESTVTTEDVTVEKDTVVADEANEDELEPPSLERTSSLDMMKATGTKAVGSLFSRFKVGRKKSPKTTGKKLEEPLSTEKDLFGDREQSVQEKEKHETVEKQENEAEEGVRPSSPSSSRSNEESQAQIDAASEHVEVETSTTVESSVVTADAEVKEMVDGSSADSAVVVSVASSEVVEKTMKTEDVGTTSASEDEVVVESVSTASTDQTAFESQQSETTSSGEELLSVKVTPTTEIHAEVAEVAEPVKMSPVKSLASRFEGKREQSLDTLKFRTVREFFPTERSIRVGAEKQKYEAQAQQQQQKAKAEEEAKSKYKVGSPFKAPVKENVSGEPSPEIKAPSVPVNDTAVIDETVSTTTTTVAATPDFSTPDTAASRKKFSFDDGYASANSPSKFSDEALTPVKSIASRFEGKREQSLDNLKFRTVREFFPEERRNRSIHVGAEKAKFEALTKQQEETAKAAEQLKLKHAVLSPTPTAVKSESAEEVLNETTEEVSDPTLKDVNEVIDETNGKSQISTEVEVEKDTGKVVMNSQDKCVELNLGDFKEQENKDNGSVENFTTGGDGQISTGSSQNTITVDKVEPAIESEDEVENCVVDDQVKPNIAITSISSDVVISEQVSVVETETVEIIDEKTQTSELGELHIEQSNVEDQVESLVPISNEDIVASVEISSVDIQQDVDTQATEKENLLTVEEGASSAENGLVDVDLDERAVEIPQSQPKSKRPILTTERSFVIEDDQTIKTEDTVVVGERPMTDGEDEFEPLSPSKTRPAHELFAGINSSRAKKELKRKTSTPKLSRKTSAGSAKSAKSPASKTTVPVPMKRSSITAPTASYTAKKAAEAEELHKSSQLTKKTSASKLKGTLSETGFFKPTPASPTVPVPMKRASITAPTASYKAKKAAEAEELHKPSPPLKKQGSASKLKGTVSETGFIKQPPAAPTVPVPMRRASITAPTASWQARNVSDPIVEGVEQRPASKNHASNFSPTVPVAPKRASIMAPTASYMAKKSAENAEDTNIEVPAAPARNKRYSNVKSKVLDGIQSGSTHATTHKLITKEEFIAAERRKSLGSAGVRNVLDAVDRRASLTARVTIDGPPEPFMRSALSRKKLNSTVPRYLDYENSQGYADRARKQYERRKRLEEENAAKSEKRQRELRAFFTEKQQKSLMSSADEVRRGLEAHEFAKLAKESEIQAQKALRTDKQRAQSTRSQSSATSTAGVLSSSGVASRTSKKSSVSTASVEEKVVVPPIESTVMEMEEAVEVVPVSEETVVETEEVIESTTVVKHETVELQQEAERAVIESAVHIEEQTIPVPVVDDDFALEHVAKKIDFDEASSDSDEKGELNE